eukprot:TRINITY_DN2960_c0_g2_i13.p1 TRINITY_DN2960_c0_g2~~TRINITY_DN2960_c0_g2_i13.p1  ORF type:complete len:373 (-),score=76.71 TRINITY_DN2960_c0_g2_i13:81-1199(-)
MLCRMRDSDLENDLEIRIRLHRLKVLESLALLGNSQAPVLENRNSNLIVPSPAKNLEAPQGKYLQEVAEKKLPHEETKTQHKLSLKFLEGALANSVFAVSDSGINIGRHNVSNEIVIPEGTVSRKHCKVYYNDKGAFIEDVGSTTGTFLMLKHKTIIKEGKTVCEVGFMFQLGGSEFRATAISPDEPKVTIEMFEGVDAVKKVELGRLGGYLGRDAKNEVALPKDQQVSSRHAHIWFEEGEFYVEDEGSTNRTWVRLSSEGCKSRPYAIANGDIGKVGASTFLVQAKSNTENAKIASIPSCIATPKGDEITRGGPNENKPVIDTCKVCHKNEANVVFIPCGHNCTCYVCGKGCAECPNCKKEVFGSFKINKH